LIWVGLAIALAGFLTVSWAYRALGASFSPFPTPTRDARLVTTGPYRFVRHPTYIGGVVMLFGLSLAFSTIGLFLTAVLAGFWVAKARHEEKLLVERFPEYADYRRRTLF